MHLIHRYRQWRLAQGVFPAGRFHWIFIVLSTVLAFALGYWAHAPEAIAPTQAPHQERAQILEMENRLMIADQAMGKLKEINNDLRERYNHLLSMLNAELQHPKSNIGTAANKSGINLRYFNVALTPSGLYRYQILLDYDGHSKEVEYGLIFDFDRGEAMVHPLDASAFSAVKGSRMVLPFFGELATQNQKVRVTTFFVKKNGKEIFSMQTKSEGG